MNNIITIVQLIKKELKYYGTMQPNLASDSACEVIATSIIDRVKKWAKEDKNKQLLLKLIDELKGAERWLEK